MAERLGRAVDQYKLWIAKQRRDILAAQAALAAARKAHAIPGTN